MPVDFAIMPDCRSTSTQQRTTPRASSKSTSTASSLSQWNEPTSTERRPYQANLHLNRRRSLDASQRSSSSPLSVRAWSLRLNIAAVAARCVANSAFVTFNMDTLPHASPRIPPRLSTGLSRSSLASRGPFERLSSMWFVSAQRRGGYRFVYRRKRGRTLGSYASQLIVLSRYRVVAGAVHLQDSTVRELCTATISVHSGAR